MLSENLQIYRDVYELSKKLYEYSSSVPKHARYGEYGNAVSMSLNALDAIYVANSDIEQRPAALTRILQLLGGVRSRVRLFGELKILSPKQSVNLSFLIEKVQKQAVGWRNASHCQSREAHRNTGEQHL